MKTDKTAKRAEKRKKKKKKKKGMALPIIMCLIGVCLMGHIVVLDWYATYKAAHTISTMSDSYEPLDDPELVALRNNAYAYNARNAGEPCDMPDEEILPYLEQMKFRGSSEMAWVSIPKIDVAIPIYHGTDENSLSSGVGHLEESSLPVGGTSTHCVLTGHSGMQGNRMFDDIRSLEVGDYFVVHSLGEPYAYQVYGIDVVWPYQRESLEPQPGKDLCTLVTCTPYGVNDHRLLVHGERVPYESWMEPNNPPHISALNIRTIPLVIAVGVIMVVVILGAFLSRWRKNKRKKALADGTPLPPKHKMSTGATLGFALLLALGTGGAITLVIDFYETNHNETFVSELKENWENSTEAEMDHEIEEAMIYNRNIAAAVAKEHAQPYQAQLNDSIPGNMGWIELYGTRSVITHEMEDYMLPLRGSMHVEETSLPIGGSSTHSVMTVNPGISPIGVIDVMTRLPQEGETVVVNVTGQQHAYIVTTVDQTVASDVSSLDTVQGEDLMTLVFPNPLGDEEERTLVHMKRVSYDEQMSLEDGIGIYINMRTLPFMTTTLVCLIGAVLMVMFSRRRRNDAVIAAVRESSAQESSAQDSSPQDSSAQDNSAQVGSPQDNSAQDSSPQDNSASK